MPTFKNLFKHEDDNGEVNSDNEYNLLCEKNFNEDNNSEIPSHFQEYLNTNPNRYETDEQQE